MYILVKSNHEKKEVQTVEINSFKWCKYEKEKLCNSGDIGFMYNKDLPPIDLDVLTMFICYHVKKGLSINRLLVLLDDIEKMENLMFRSC